MSKEQSINDIASAFVTALQVRFRVIVCGGNRLLALIGSDVHRATVGSVCVCVCVP